jgi:hypothetical protein
MLFCIVCIQWKERGRSALCLWLPVCVTAIPQILIKIYIKSSCENSSPSFDFDTDRRRKTVLDMFIAQVSHRLDEISPAKAGAFRVSRCIVRS